MILNEQKYSNKTRLYYHGTDTGKFCIGKWNAGFLTTEIEYALKYTNKFQILIGNIKAPLNIFNARSNIDLYRIIRIVDLNQKDIEILQNMDWLNSPLSIKREDLLWEIENLKYDGIFNYECSYERFKKIGPENPSIGLFKEDNFVNTTLLKYEDIIKNKRTREFIERQQNIIEEYIKNLAYKDARDKIYRTEDNLLMNVFFHNETKYIEKRYPNTSGLYKIYKEYNDETKLEKFLEWWEMYSKERRIKGDPLGNYGNF